MIVVVGSPIGRLVDGAVSAAGTVSRIALAAAAAGRTVQLVGRTGDDPTADAVILDLARGGVGHVALLRDPARTTSLDAADVDLGLRYLTDFAVVVLAEAAGPGIVEVVGEAARWADARLLLIVGAGEPVPDGLPPDAVVFEAPATDADGLFAAFVGSFAAALDDGTEPAEALRASLAAQGWTASGVD
jgi:sugar/nucleoside kinase (ribokinase family)